MANDTTARLGRRIGAGIVFGVVLYAVFAAATDAAAVGRALGTLPATLFALALGLSLVNYAMRWAKWEFYLRTLGIRIGAGESVFVFLSGLTMSITPGKVGEVLKSVLLKERRGIAVERTAPIVVAERVTDLFGLIVIASFGIATFDYGRAVFVVVLAGLVGVMVGLQFPSWVSGGLDLVERLPWLGNHRAAFDAAYASMRELVRPIPLVVTTLMSTLSWSMEAAAFHFIIEALDPLRLEATVSSFVFAMTTILGAVSFLPGGLGVTEGTMVGALLLFGVFEAEAKAVSATYLIRLATLWFGVALGVLGLVAFRATSPRSE